jgi:predicted Zn-dependent protease with MMP-like domain
MARRARMSTLSMSPEEFEGLVRQAVDGLPDQYRRLLKNVAVVVEPEPSREVLEEMGMESEDDLLGLYSGTARDAESFFDPGGHLPSKISIYRGPILRLCRTPEEVVQEVRDTVVHEIGHHFGLDDEEMPY